MRCHSMRRHYRIEFEPNQNLDISDHNKNTLTFYSFCICNWMNMKVEMPAESASVIHLRHHGPWLGG